MEYMGSFIKEDKTDDWIEQIERVGKSNKNWIFNIIAETLNQHIKRENGVGCLHNVHKMLSEYLNLLASPRLCWNNAEKDLAILQSNK